MDKEKLKTELKECLDQGLYYLAQLHLLDLVVMEQKSKKTEKMITLNVCSFKALYATKKYGCSGIEEYDDCLGCEFRR